MCFVALHQEVCSYGVSLREVHHVISLFATSHKADFPATQIYNLLVLK